jgi:AraC family L-rhamnose operon regulatory protein RhaS
LLEAYLAWLHRNFYESLSLEEAAAATGMSRRTFTNRFKARTGTTWLDYVNVLRIRHAEALLKQTDKKITSIAFQCGFDDLTTFYRAFKRIKGVHPSQLRS